MIQKIIPVVRAGKLGDDARWNKQLAINPYQLRFNEFSDNLLTGDAA